MSDTDLAKILADVKEGLVVHPGDHLVLSFPPGPDAELQEFVDRLRQRFALTNIAVTCIAGTEQIAVIRRDDRCGICQCATHSCPLDCDCCPEHLS